MTKIVGSEKNNIIKNIFLWYGGNDIITDIKSPITEEIEVEDSYLLSDFFCSMLRYGFQYNERFPEIELMEKYGGGEGGAEDCGSIIRINDEYIRFSYTYTSSSGYSFESISSLEDIGYELVLCYVSPEKKVITVYV